MNTIKGLHKLNALKSSPISAELLKQLDNEAIQYKTNWNIDFEILGVLEKFILIKSTQSNVFNKNYSTHYTIINETKKMFGKYIPRGDIHVRACINIPAPPSIVNSQWLEKNMYDSGIFLSELQSATGIDTNTLEELITDAIPMNRPIKAMFYYYFLYMKNIRDSTL